MSRRVVGNLRELNAALSDRKAKQIVLKPEKTKSFDLQILKKAAQSGKEFCVLFLDFLEANALERKRLFVKYFLLFKIARKAGLKIRVLGEHPVEELEFFREFLGSEGKCM